ncbi:MAG: DegV family protein [bacterium]
MILGKTRVYRRNREQHGEITDKSLLQITGRVGAMMPVRVITDSACDLPSELFKAHNIKFASLSVTFADRTYTDGVDLTRDEFYDRLAQGGDLPMTAQPSPHAFLVLMQEALAAGDEVVVVTLSSGLSGTFESAQAAYHSLNKEEQRRVHLVDSRTAATGEGLLVLQAVRLAEQGKSGQEIVENLRGMISSLASVFTVDTLENLRKGGRISRIKALLGTVLEIKPILELDREGHIVVKEKVRGRRKAVRRLLEIMAAEGKNLSDQVVGIAHGHVPEAAAELEHAIRERFNAKEIIVGEISATIGTHTGPGCLAVFFHR